MNAQIQTEGSPQRVPASVETGTTLRIDIKNVGSQLNSILVGVDPDDRYWVIRTPQAVVSGNIRLLPNDHVTVRFLHHGKVMGSGAYLLSATHDPDHLMFITIPQVLAEQNLRSTPRVTCFLPARLTVNGSEAVIGAIKDISHGGCRVLVKPADGLPAPHFPDQSPILVSFRATHMEAELAYNGIVRNSVMEDGRLAVGIKFDEFSHEAQYKAIERLSTLM